MTSRTSLSPEKACFMQYSRRLAMIRGSPLHGRCGRSREILRKQSECADRARRSRTPCDVTAGSRKLRTCCVRLLLRWRLERKKAMLLLVCSLWAEPREAQKAKRACRSCEAIACDVRFQWRQQKNADALCEALASLEAGAEEGDVDRTNINDVGMALVDMERTMAMNDVSRASFDRGLHTFTLSADATMLFRLASCCSWACTLRRGAAEGRAE